MNAADKMDASIDGTMVALAKARKGWVVHWTHGTMVALAKARKGWVVHWTHPAREAHPFRLDCVDDIGNVINRHAVEEP